MHTKNMPVIGEQYKKKIILPNYPEEAWVEIVTNPKADLFEKLTDDTDKIIALYNFLAKIITNWNFTNQDGTVAEITAENIKIGLSAFDISFIEEQLNMGLDAKKKSS